MNREIKFRGKRDDMSDYSWKYGSLIKEGDKYFIRTTEMNGNSGLGNEVFPETVGQFTGLTDKNGKEIYEGDLICVTEKGYISEVEYKDGCFWMFNEERKIKRIRLGSFHPKPIHRVIGNIHE